MRKERLELAHFNNEQIFSTASAIDGSYVGKTPDSALSKLTESKGWGQNISRRYLAEAQQLLEEEAVYNIGNVEISDQTLVNTAKLLRARNRAFGNATRSLFKKGIIAPEDIDVNTGRLDIGRLSLLPHFQGGKNAELFHYLEGYQLTKRSKFLNRALEISAAKTNEPLLDEKRPLLSGLRNGISEIIDDYSPHVGIGQKIVAAATVGGIIVASYAVTSFLSRLPLNIPTGP